MCGERQPVEPALPVRAEVGDTDLVGMNRLNPQLQEQVIRNSSAGKGRGGTAQTFAEGKAAPEGARNRSARPWEK